MWFVCFDLFITSSEIYLKLFLRKKGHEFQKEKITCEHFKKTLLHNTDFVPDT
jgi:hypothetical protein